MFREDMVQIAANNGQALRYDTDTGRGKRISEDELPEPPKPKKAKKAVKEDPVLALIKNAADVKPVHLEISEIPN